MSKNPILHETWIAAKNHQETKLQDIDIKQFNNIAHFRGDSLDCNYSI